MAGNAGRDRLVERANLQHRPRRIRRIAGASRPMGITIEALLRGAGAGLNLDQPHAKFRGLLPREFQNPGDMNHPDRVIAADVIRNGIAGANLHEIPGLRNPSIRPAVRASRPVAALRRLCIKRDIGGVGRRRKDQQRRHR